MWHGGGDAPFPTQINAHACSCSHFERATNFTSLVWQPAECSIVPWDARKFCQVLGQRRLLFVGDSTVQQVAALTANHVEHAYRRRGEPGLGCASQLEYALADTLVHRPMRDEHGNTGSNRGHRWSTWVDMYKPDIVVLGAGPHVYGRANFVTLLAEVAEEHARRFPQVQLFWQTTTAAFCGAAPLSRPPSRTPGFWAAHPGGLYDPRTKRGVVRRNWMDFEWFDAHAREFWASRAAALSSPHDHRDRLARATTRAGHRQSAMYPSPAVVDLGPLHLRPDARISSYPQRIKATARSTGRSIACTRAPRARCASRRRCYCMPSSLR